MCLGLEIDNVLSSLNVECRISSSVPPRGKRQPSGITVYTVTYLCGYQKTELTTCI